MAKGKAPVKRTYIGEDFKDVMELPNLIDIQLKSYEEFLQRDVIAAGKTPERQGLEDVFQSTFPIKSQNGDIEMRYVS